MISIFKFHYCDVSHYVGKQESGLKTDHILDTKDNLGLIVEISEETKEQVFLEEVEAKIFLVDMKCTMMNLVKGDTGNYMFI